MLATCRCSIPVPAILIPFFLFPPNVNIARDAFRKTVPSKSRLRRAIPFASSCLSPALFYPSQPRSRQARLPALVAALDARSPVSSRYLPSHHRSRWRSSGFELASASQPSDARAASIALPTDRRGERNREQQRNPKIGGKKGRGKKGVSVQRWGKKRKRREACVLRKARRCCSVLGKDKKKRDRRGTREGSGRKKGCREVR